MSISSCPRCAGQVTLPVGLSNTAVVRCPLCRAQFTLADALVNMPPLLEVVDDATQSATIEWMESADDAKAARAGESDTIQLDTLELGQDLSDLVADADESGSADSNRRAAKVSSVDDSLDDESLESDELPADSDELPLEFDELPISDEAEDDAGESELPDLEASEEPDEFATMEFKPEADEPELDLDVLRASDAAETVSFSAGDVRGKTGEEDLSFDFGEPNGAAETVEFDAADFDQDLAGNRSNDNDAELPFSIQADDPSGDAEPLEEFEAESLDFGEGIADDDPAALPMAAMVTPTGEASAVAIDADASGGKKKKDKKKKEKKVKVAVPDDAAPRRKRSLVGLLGGVVLPGLIAVPIALFGALWLSPAYDFFGVGKMLPAFMLPKGFHQQVAKAPVVPYTPPQEHSVGKPELPPDEPAVGDEAPPAPEEPAPEAPAAETPAAEPPAPEAPAAETPAEEMPAEEPAAEEPAAEAPAAGEPAADDPFKTPSGPAVEEPEDPFATPPEEMPAEEPAQEPAAPAEDDPFGEPAAATPSADKPAAEKPSADDPEDLFNTPAEPGEMPAEPAELPAPEEPAAPAAELGPRNAKSVPATELAAAGQAVMQSSQTMMTAESAGDEAQLRKARMAFYLSLFGLAEALTFVENDPSGSLDPQLQMFEQAARQQLGADPKRRHDLQVFAGRWMTFPKRTTNGIALAGKVESVEKVGPLYHAKVKLGAANAESLVTVVSAKDPKLAAGDEFLTLGSIVEKPAEAVAGYEGDEAAVVWSGMTLKLDGSN